MSERKRHPDRSKWGAPRRIAFRCWCGLYATIYAIVGPLLTKHEDGTVTLSWTAVFAGGLLVVITRRLLPLPEGTVLAPIGWDVAFVIVMTLFVKPINDAVNAYARRNPEGLVNALLSRMGVGEVGQGATALRAAGTDNRFTDDERG